MSGLKNSTADCSGLRRIWQRVAGFRRNEGGGMIIFGLYIFVIMLWMGGMAVDFMRFEHERAKVQYTLDRAALAAASLNQPLPCEDVARDYFEKSGIDSNQVTVTGTCTDLSSIVTVSAETTVKSFFINLMGIESMTAAGTSTAEESIKDVEISMVLDVSGSMGWDDATGTQTKLAALQTAAGEFLDELLTNDNLDRISVNVIPYNMQVNAGEDILNELNVSNEHDYSHCIDFKSEDFATVEISADVAEGASLGDLSLDGTTVMGTRDELQRSGHFDPFYTTKDLDHISSDDGATRLFNCPTSEESEITLMSQNKSELKTMINSLTAGGNTSIDLGVKWGSFFLNPNAEPLVDALADDSTNLTSGGVPVAFQDRPYEYDRENTIKIMVVMTDGVNTTQYMLDEDYDSGDSDIWLDPNSSWLSHYKWRAGPDNNYFMSYGSTSYDYFSGNRYNQGGDERLTYPELWKQVGVKYFAYYYNYVRDWDANEYYDTRDDILDYVYASEKNTRLNNACTAAKDEGVIIYSIGFEVSDASAVVMENCASTPSDFFRVEGTEISEAFGKIAQTIQRLKLTQ
ncbi:TadE/TadG family type IV pilus assembly protein [uncultured Litoreibacter sp.]|uniref:TadE/TadG family type IV pilus assembly protein n=1 Tax=uncultured Litoreibacter sp. TaxID=1392394 RepID=UPI0026343014|nr:TadE/TadG family type IV pilus assembly protein [uncultured Litoreibacter sp.]